MHRRHAIVVRALAVSLAIAAPFAFAAPKATAETAKTPATKPQAKPEDTAIALSPVECEVWNRERSFANSVENHDAKAFADHVDANAAFNAGTRAPVHGRAAVVEDWKDIIEGKQIKLRWSPRIVTVGGDGSLAISRGPAWIEDPRPDAKPRYRVGEFISTWSRNSDGRWRVLFDSSGTPMHPASAEEVEQLIASIPRSCPAAPR